MGIMDRWSRKADKRPIISSAGGVISGGSPASPAAIMQRTENWQTRVMAYSSSVPEVTHAGRFVENTTGKVKLNVVGDSSTDALLTAQLVDVPVGRACINLFFIGEVLMAYKYEGGRTRWKAWGKEDYKYEKNKPLKVKGEDGKFRELDDGWKWFRVFREDPADQYKAWSTHKSQLDLLESMYVHQLADTAIATSRLAGAGVFYIPNDELMDMPATDAGEPEPGSQAHFEERLRSAMTDSLRNRRAEDAVVPVFMFGSSEFADGLRHVLMERVDNAEAFARRMESMTKRYGTNIDLPVEIVTGMGDTNHWAGWKVDQNTWNYYLEPMVSVVVDALLKNFVDPVHLALGGRAAVGIAIDATAVIVKPDRTDAALRAHGMGALSAEGLLFYAGFDPQFLHPLANQPKSAAATQPDGAVRLPSANFRGSEGTPVGDRNVQR